MDRRNIVKTLLLLLLMGLATGIIWRLQHAPPPSQGLRTATTSIGNITETVMAQGKLEPKQYVDVGLQVSGQIQKLHVAVSDAVQAGQLLAEIDPRLYNARVIASTAQLASLRARIREQQATIALATSRYHRTRTLHNRKNASTDMLEQAETTLEQARAVLASLKAQAEEAESRLAADRTNLEYTSIYAPMSGVIASLPVREGQTLNAVQSAPVLMQIANLDTMTVRAQVAEADIPRVRIGMAASFTTLGDMEKRWQGTVRLIQPAPDIINDVVLYNVLIDAANPGHTLMSGMTAQVFLESGKAENVILLPLEALGKRLPEQDRDGSKAYAVQLHPSGKTRTIHIGLTTRLQAEVRHGLKTGETVRIPARIQPNGRPPQPGIPPGMTGAPRL